MPASSAPAAIPREFPMPTPGDVWKAKHARGTVVAAVVYVIHRGEDWEAIVYGPSGMDYILPHTTNLTAQSWVPKAWNFNDTRNVWEPPAPTKIRSSRK